MNEKLLARLEQDKPLGFTRNGGSMRFYMGVLAVSQVEWWATLDFALEQKLIVDTGQVDASGIVYSWVANPGA